MHWPVVSTIGGRITTLALTYAVVVAGLGFKSFMWASVVGQAVVLAISLLLVRHALRIRIRPRVDRQHWRALIRSGIVLGGALSIGQIYFRIDTVVLALLRPAREVGLYGASYKFLELAEIAPFAILNSLFPTMSRFVREGDTRLRPLAQSAFDLGLALGAPALVLGITFAPELIEVSAGKEFAQAAPAFQILAPYLLATLALTPALGLLLAVEADRWLFISNAAILVFNLALNFALIPPFGFKVAAATSLGSEVLCVAVFTVLAHRRTGFLPSLRSVPALALATGAMIVVTQLVPGPVLVVAVLSLAVYVALVGLMPGSVRRAIGQVARRLG
jgi:O-antigen/teichoic acid export membrane protein